MNGLVFRLFFLEYCFKCGGFSIRNILLPSAAMLAGMSSSLLLTVRYKMGDYVLNGSQNKQRVKTFARPFRGNALEQKMTSTTNSVILINIIRHNRTKRLCLGTNRSKKKAWNTKRDGIPSLLATRIRKSPQQDLFPQIRIGIGPRNPFLWWKILFIGHGPPHDLSTGPLPGRT